MCPRHAPDDDYDDEDYGPSKSDQKKSMERLQALGERLGGLGEDQLRKLPLDETLLAALLELRRLKAHEAIRRQKQFIGKLMRHADEEAILGALHPLRNPALLRDHRPYAVCAFVGAWVVVALPWLGAEPWQAMLAGGVVSSLLRIVALWTGYTLPRWSAGA